MKFLNLTARKLVMILAFLSPIIAHAQATDLIISEYVEGSSYNKAIEIYNGTGSPVDLSSYSIEKDVNGDNAFGSTLSLSGTLNSGETFVIAHSSASSSILAVADLTDYSSMNFNGNDQVRLVKNSSEIDRIGVSGATFAQDITYRRNPEVTSPASGPQDPQTNGEWTAFATDDVSDLGSHTMNGSGTAKATELFISEYVEGSSYNKAIEIFNGTGSPVDLTAYSLQKDTNGDAIFSSEFSLSGTLADGDVLVIMNSNIAKKNQKYGDILTSSSALNFNGNDQVRLVKNGTEIDRIGISGGINFGQDVTFVRDETVGSPATGEQDPRSNGEWLAYGVDEFSYLGTHTMNATSTGGGSSSTNTTEILISEYVEGSSYNKAIELYNGTGAAVDLSAYSLEKDTNGDNIFGSTFTLSGTLNNSETYIVTHSSADATLLGLANITDFGSMNFNGNDQVRLLKDGVEIDRIGISGGADFAIDITYVRDKNVTSPVTGEQDPATNGEWIALATDDFSNLGIHPSDVTGSGGGGTPPSGGSGVTGYANTLDVVTFNMEWLGAPAKAGKTITRAEQLATAAQELVNTDADVYALQEIVIDDVNGDALADLLAEMNNLSGAGTWAGQYNPYFSYYWNPDFANYPAQRQAFIYNTSTVNYVNHQTLLTWIPSGDSRFASGRLPFMLTADVTVDGTTQRVSFIDLHLKCCTGNAARRQTSMLDLVAKLDSTYSVENMIVLGDFNVADNGGAYGEIATWGIYDDKDLDGIADYTHAAGAEADEAFEDIDHILISNELNDEYNAVVSTDRNLKLTTTISDHNPIMTRLSLSGTAAGQDPVTGTGGTDPATYYNGTSGLSGAALKQKLHEIIRGHVRFPYTSSSTDVWDILKETDEDPSNPNNLILIYTGRSQDKSTQDTGSGDNDAWNREHVWAKSHGFPNSTDTAYTDVHHLRPADKTVNSSRGNKDFDNGGTQHIEATGCYSDTDSWEPRDAVKGDVARMMFYMVVRYEYGAYDLELVDYTGTDTTPLFGKLSTLLQWHQQDPVDDWERNRNEVIFTQFQGNRNPFIDHPEFVDMIWGTASARIMSNEEKLEASTLEVYPNPSNGQFRVELPSNIEIGSDIRIIDLNGRVINKLKATQQSINIDISTAPEGIYFLQIATDNGFLFERISKQ